MEEELRNTFDTVYLHMQYAPERNCFLHRWEGYITVDNIKEGYSALLSLLQEQPCPSLLVNNQRIVGRSWSQALTWLTQEWAPLSVRAGLRRVAIVIAPGSFAGLGALQLQERLNTSILEVSVFEDDEAAMAWLGKA